MCTKEEDSVAVTAELEAEFEGGDNEREEDESKRGGLILSEDCFRSEKLLTELLVVVKARLDEDDIGLINADD